jgi:hypothetical protein
MLRSHRCSVFVAFPKCTRCLSKHPSYALFSSSARRLTAAARNPISLEDYETEVIRYAVRLSHLSVGLTGRRRNFSIIAHIGQCWAATMSALGSYNLALLQTTGNPPWLTGFSKFGQIFITGGALLKLVPADGHRERLAAERGQSTVP